MIKVKKVGDSLDGDFNLYCGRGSTPYGMMNAEIGNPYIISIPFNITRNDVITLFKKELFEQKTKRSHEWRSMCEWAKNEHMLGKQINLFCHCHPKKCHCDAIKQYIESL